MLTIFIIKLFGLLFICIVLCCIADSTYWDQYQNALLVTEDQRLFFYLDIKYGKNFGIGLSKKFQKWTIGAQGWQKLT
jgi:hypothetical protein